MYRDIYLYFIIANQSKRHSDEKALQLWDEFYIVLLAWKKCKNTC